MGEIDPVTQRVVLEYYQENAMTAVPVGDYVRVKVENRDSKACFGPDSEDISHGWQVIEIDFKEGQFLLAPIENRTLEE
jgi:hypothetical protein